MTLALVNANHHPGAVDVADLERNHLGGTQAGAVGNTQGRLVFDARRRRQQPRHFIRTEHHRQPPRLAGEHDIFGDVTPSQGDLEEEA